MHVFGSGHSLFFWGNWGQRRLAPHDGIFLGQVPWTGGRGDVDADVECGCGWVFNEIEGLFAVAGTPKMRIIAIIFFLLRVGWGNGGGEVIFFFFFFSYPAPFDIFFGFALRGLGPWLGV